MRIRRLAKREQGRMFNDKISEKIETNEQSKAGARGAEHNASDQPDSGAFNHSLSHELGNK